MSESRLHKSYLNARVNVFFYLVTLFISFFSRKIFLEKLGADFVGLTGTMGNLPVYTRQPHEVRPQLLQKYLAREERDEQGDKVKEYVDTGIEITFMETGFRH